MTGKIISTKNSLWFLCAFILFFIILQQYVFALQNFDASWCHALVNATVKNFNFSSQFIFTYGPAWFFFHHIYNPELYPFFILSGIFTAVVLAICISSGSRKLLTLLLLVWSCLLAPTEDIWPLFIIVAMHRLAISQKLSFPNAIILLWLGFIAYSKFTCFILTCPLILLIDLNNIALKNYRFPKFSAVYAGCLVFAYGLLGQNIASIFTFFAHSMEMASGYSKALGIPLDMLNLTQAYIFIGLFLLVGVSSVVAIFQNSSDAPASKFFKSIAVLWMFYAIFKMGYVRADFHIYCTQLVFILLMLYMLIKSVRFSFYSMVCSASLATVFLILLPRENIFSLKEPLFRLHEVTLSKSLLDQRYTIMKNAVAKTKIPIPLNATVDAYPSDIAELILGGYNYYPRPVCQCNVSSTPGLQNMDNAHLAQNKTDYVLIKPDNDYPTFIFGKSLLTIFKNYDVDDYCFVGSEHLPSVIMKRRNEPKAKIRVDSFTTELSAGKWTTLPPQKADFREVTIDFRPTWIGDVKNFLLHQDIAWLEVKTEADTVCRFRFIPNVAQNGFLLSPLMLTASNMVFYKNAGKIKKLRIYSDYSSMFNSTIHITAIDFNLTGAPENKPACDSAELVQALAGGRDTR